MKTLFNSKTIFILMLTVVWNPHFYLDGISVAAQENHPIALHSSASQSVAQAETINYNKTVQFFFGIGSIEFLNAGVAVRLHGGLYAAVSGGVTLADEEAFLNIPADEFLKAGIIWKIKDASVTPVISAEAGRAFLDAQRSTPEMFIPQYVNLVSLLAGIEWRSHSGLTFSLRLGERYRQTYKSNARFDFGFQATVGYTL